MQKVNKRSLKEEIEGTGYIEAWRECFFEVAGPRKVTGRYLKW